MTFSSFFDLVSWKNQKKITPTHTTTKNSIYEAIGRGRHSVVYKGRRKKTIDYYAIKSVDKSLKPRVLQEVSFFFSSSSSSSFSFISFKV